MSNSNTRMVLSALGFSPDFEDEPGFSIDEFEKAVDLYLTSELGTLIDNGVELVQRGNVVDCGRRSGYITEKVQEMKPLIAQAREKGLDYVYFA